MNKTFETLYTRDSLGNIRIWWMEQEGNKYRTWNGIQGSKSLVNSEWTLAEAKNVGKKNATTDVEQATSEIENKYKKQLKTSYYKNIKDVYKTKYVEPTLAKLYKDYATKIDISKGEWGLQCKFNGMRCVATKDGLFTRKGEKYISVPHIQKSLEPFFKKYPTAVLDGELFNNDLRQQLNEICKLIRKTKHINITDLNQSEKLVKYYVYDGYNFDMDTTELSEYNKRKRWIDINVVGSYKYIEKVTTEVITSQSQLDESYKKYLDDQQEGGILRNLNAPYEHKRSKNLLKLKSEDDDEAVIVEVIEGNGNWSGTAKTATIKWNNVTFDATFKGTQEQLSEILKNKQNWIGKQVTFLYNGLTGLGVPNYARIDVNNCIKGDR